jgi:hypothetical protein
VSTRARRHTSRGNDVADSREMGYLPLRDREALRRGTFAPFLRASLSPIAIACFRLFTLRPEPLFSVPFFLRCIADLTRLPAALPYFAMSFANANAVLRSSAGT